MKRRAEKRMIERLQVENIQARRPNYTLVSHEGQYCVQRW
jgi:hypothetical protein